MLGTAKNPSTQNARKRDGPVKASTGRLGLPGALGDPVSPEVVVYSKAPLQRLEVLAAGFSG
jgi:hypothetical protein